MKSVRHERCTARRRPGRDRTRRRLAGFQDDVPFRARAAGSRRRGRRRCRIPLLGAGDAVGAGFASALDPRVGADPLSGLFLGTLGVVAAPALVFAAGYLGDGPRGRTVGVLTAAFLLALALVLCARDPLTFLAGWESITLLSATAILVWRRADEGSRAPSSPTWR